MSLAKLSQMNPEILGYVKSVLCGNAQDPPQSEPDDWKKAFRLLSGHGILPLLYWKIKQLNQQNGLPDGVLGTMRQAFLRGVQESLLMENQILEIARALDGKGVVYRILKGPGLAQTVYPDKALRPSGDIDILILPRQFLEARQALEEIGYACRAKNFEQSGWFAKDEGFIKEGAAFKLELHFNILAWPRMRRHWDVEAFFQQSTDFALSGGYPVHALQAADALIHSILHLFVGHQDQERLIWLYDIALLADKLSKTGQWPMALELSRKRQVLLAVEYGLEMTKQWTPLQIPQECRDYFRRYQPTAVEKRDWEIARNIKSGILNKLRMYWTEETGLPDKLRITFMLAFPSPEHVKDHFRPSHPFMIFSSYFRRILNHIQ